MEVKTVARKYKESLLRKCLAQYTHTQNGHTHILFRVSRANHSNFEKLLTKNRQMSRKCVLCLDNQDYHFAFHRSND